MDNVEKLKELNKLEKELKSMHKFKDDFDDEFIDKKIECIEKTNELLIWYKEKFGYKWRSELDKDILNNILNKD